MARQNIEQVIVDAKKKAHKICEVRSFYGRHFVRKNIPQAVKFEIIKRDNLMCTQCLRILPLDHSRKQLSIPNGHFHHIIPLIYGGENVKENICLLCSDCHLQAHSGQEKPEKYYEMYESYVRYGYLWGRGR